jgi:two-component system OmpR family sensor kinase
VPVIPGSLRTRLVLVFTLGASAALILSLILLYLLLVRQLNIALDEDLTERSGDLATAAFQGDFGAVRRDPLAQLYAGDGTLLSSSPSLADRRLLSASEVQTLTGKTLTTRSLPLRGGHAPARQLSRRIRHGRVLAVAVSSKTMQTARERLSSVLFVAAPLLIGALAVADWLIVRRALHPVRALTRKASTISTLETGQRLPSVPGDDEIAELARALDSMLARLRVAFERERAFIDDASHELRTPIAVLQGHLELALATTGYPQEVKQSLQAALTEADRLSRLADDLLLLAREQAGSLIVCHEPVDLLDLARAEADWLEPALTLHIEVTGDPVVVMGDGIRLRQVIANLAANSAAAGATTLRLTTTHNPGSVTLEVADDGPGFPPDLLPSAFERFVRGDRARARGSSGAGLGLSIARIVITAHGGTIGATNGAPLGGAVITARLPTNGR